MAKTSGIKKVVLIILAGVVTLIVAVVVVKTFEKGFKDGPFKRLSSGESEKFVEKKVKEGKIKRDYPEIIKGNWEPSAHYMSELMQDEVDNLKKLGVNIVSVAVEGEIKEDGSFVVENEEMVRSNILKAKENGFAVLVSPNFVGGGNPELKERGIAMLEETYLDTSTQQSLK